METIHNQFIKINDKLKNDIAIIIEAFINFYGEKNQEYIVNKLKNSKIIWYSDDKIIDVDDIHNYIISSISKEELEELLKKRSKIAFLQSAYIDELDVLVLPLSYDLNHIIHEMNHKIGSHILSKEPLIQISGLSYSIERAGMVLDMDYYFNEIINEKMTLEILAEMDLLGIKVSKTSSWQENLFPLIELFYEYFKDILKETFISGNLVKLVNLLGKENYEELSQFILLKRMKITKALKKGETPEILPTDIEKAENIVKRMKVNYENITQVQIQEERKK